MSDNKIDNSLKVSIYLAEYQSLRTEQMKRIDSQNQAFYYLLVVLGIAATAAVTGFTKTDQMPQIFFWILLFLPTITAPLAFIFFDHELAIHSVGSYIYWVWTRKAIYPLIQNKHVFEDSLSFPLLHESSKEIHGKLSDSRWNLFLIPTHWTTRGVILYAAVYHEWWWRVITTQPAYKTLFGAVFCAVIWGMNMKSSRLIRDAIEWTKRKHDVRRDLIIYLKPRVSDGEVAALKQRLLALGDHEQGGTVSNFEKFPSLVTRAGESHGVYVLTFAEGASEEQRLQVVSEVAASPIVQAHKVNVIPAEVTELSLLAALEPPAEPALGEGGEAKR